MGEPQAKDIMFTARAKIKKDKGAQPNDLEQQVAQAFVDLEINNEELRPTLKNLHIVGAREVVVNKSTAAIVVFIPYRLRELFRKNQVRLVCELEKKFSGQHVVLIAIATSRTRRSTPTARLPRARCVPAPVHLPQCTKPSSVMLYTLPTSAPSVPATPWTETST